MKKLSVILLLALAISGCGGGSDSSASSPDGSVPSDDIRWRATSIFFDKNVDQFNDITYFTIFYDLRYLVEEPNIDKCTIARYSTTDILQFSIDLIPANLEFIYGSSVIKQSNKKLYVKIDDVANTVTVSYKYNDEILETFDINSFNTNINNFVNNLYEVPYKLTCVDHDGFIYGGKVKLMFSLH